jgi:acyl-[acyl carrier protein]--UDP-N-acetylglucosamine O-acyltransferase
MVSRTITTAHFSSPSYTHGPDFRKEPNPPAQRGTMANISPQARIDAECRIAGSAIIHGNVSLGKGSVVEDFCIIGNPARGEWAGNEVTIGPGAHIRSHSVLYEGSTFGPGLMTGHHCVLREGLTAGVNLQVGSYCDLEGDAVIGDWVRFHSSVHLGRGTKVGDLVWIFPYVVTNNDPAPPSGLKVGAEIGDGCVICTSAVVLPGTRLGVGSFVGAMSRVGGHVPSAAVYSGNPAVMVGSLNVIRDLQDMHHQKRTRGQGTTWMGHYAKFYPEEAQERIRQIQAVVEIACTSDVFGQRTHRK